MAGRGIDYVIDKAREVWQIEPHRHVRIPPAPGDEQPISVDALWTDYGLRPSANNLAFMVQSVQESEIGQWKQRLSYWPIRAGLLVSDNTYFLQCYDLFGQLEQKVVEPESLIQELNPARSRLFTPKGLSRFRTGQLSLADLEESISENSLSFILRQQAELDAAFQEAIKSALAVIPQNSEFINNQIEGHVIRVAIAYMAARILEDKGFFDSDLSIPTNDPWELLNRTLTYTNGFFKRALDRSRPCLEEFIPDEVDSVLGNLATHLGHQVSFALVDHRDVGLLYERAINKLPHQLKDQDWTDLQRHYTPVAIAEKMLELLPLERLRPEERIIFDPAAGSGSLLLAATSRLAGMMDIPENLAARKSYLANHVVGNDLDQYADLVTQLRYTLARESLGQDIPFPFPHKFTHEDYELLDIEKMGIKPRVIVANPPFAEDGNTQRAARFIEKALNWLEPGSQFAFILPQSFLTNTTHGVPNARRLLAENCQIFEIWQCPEKVIGIDAEQAVCMILGQIGKSKIIIPSAARAVFSRRKDTISSIRNDGFLGHQWITQLNSDNSANWESFTVPSISIQVPTIPLENLFFVFNGVTTSKHYKPVSQCPPNIECKLNWRMKWRDPERLWVDPSRVPQDERWLMYGREYLSSARLEWKSHLDLPKIFVGRKVNRGSVYPLAAQLDTTGLCPDNDIFCVLPIQQAGKPPQLLNNQEFVQEWNQLTDADQRLWLLGILVSKIANALSLIGRKTSEITINGLRKLPLPQRIDPRIIDITRQIIERDQQHKAIPEPDNLRVELNEIVEESYGNPHWIEIKRTGEPPELELWKAEQTKPTLTVIGQVLEISQDNTQILLYLSGLLDDNAEAWLPILPEIPGWALDGTVFEAELSEYVETFEQIVQHPWAIRNFRHTPYPYLTNEELKQKLRIDNMEERL